MLRLKITSLINNSPSRKTTLSFKGCFGLSFWLEVPG